MKNHVPTDTIYGLVGGMLGLGDTTLGYGASVAEWSYYGNWSSLGFLGQIQWPTGGEAISQQIYPQAAALGRRIRETGERITPADLEPILEVAGIQADCPPCHRPVRSHRVYRNFSTESWEFGFPSADWNPRLLIPDDLR